MSMRHGRTMTAVAALGALAIVAGAGTAAATDVTQTNLVSDGTIPAAFTDHRLVNAWGVAYFPGGPFWVTDNGTGLSTLYVTNGKPQSLVVTIPPAAGATSPSPPTGIVSNPTTGFAIPSGTKSSPALFMFVTEQGTISGWNGGTKAVTVIDNFGGGKGAVYKGAAMSVTGGVGTLLAANFRSGMVEEYDPSFKLIHSFRDTTLPANYAPFNVAVLGGKIFVAYALQLAGGQNDNAGRGHGFVDEVDITGKLIHRIESRGPLNSPWGMAIAPANFGGFGGALLVGNNGNGRMFAFDIAKHKLLGTITSGGKPLVIPQLWALIVGNGGQGGLADSVYFAGWPRELQARVVRRTALTRSFELPRGVGDTGHAWPGVFNSKFATVAPFFLWNRLRPARVSVAGTAEGPLVDEDLRTSLAALAPKLRRFALALTGSNADADDLVQSACERAMRRSDQLREATRLDGWMYGIMRHLWLDEARARRVRRHDDLDHASTTIGTDGEAVAFGRISLGEVRRALALLSADYRCVLTLVCVDGLSYRDAAAVLDIPIGTVMSRLSRARRELQDRLHATKVSGTVTPLPLPNGRSRPRTA